MWPAIATRGAQGLGAIATTALGLAWGTNGSVDEVLGHRRRAGRLAHRRRVELELKLRLGLGRHHAARVFERTPLDPLADQLDLGVGDLGRVGRHLGLFLVRDHQEERAVVGIARLDHLARAAPLHGRAVVVEVQAPLLLVGVVARAATAAEDGRHVVLVGDLRLGRVGGEPRPTTAPGQRRAGPIRAAARSFDRMVIVSLYGSVRCAAATATLTVARRLARTIND